MTSCLFAKFKDGKYFSYIQYVDSILLLVVIFNLLLDKNKVVMTYSFEKNNLVEDPFALGMEIYWDKKKGH